MSEREGLYCEKHVKFWAGGVCNDCGPAALMMPACSPADHVWINDSLLCACGAKRLPERYGGVPKARPCDHANGYCKDTAHKYELVACGGGCARCGDRRQAKDARKDGSMTKDEAMGRYYDRVPPIYRFVSTDTLKPVPPFGHHYPWRDNPGTCAMCERGPAELSVPGAPPCDFGWPEE